MINFAQLGNDLYTGKRSVRFIQNRRRWYIASGVVMVIALVGLLVFRLNLGLEFTGGSEFRVSTTAAGTQNYEARAKDAVRSVGSAQDANVTKLGSNTVRVQTEQLDDTQSANVRDALAKEFDVPNDKVSANFIGPSWGASLSQQALRALIVFLALTMLVMALYFRTWKMALAALVALLHDMVITVGVYALTGFEVSPATMIGFLTVLGYSLYDTVVVFDKVRENTGEAFAGKRVTYAQAANLAVNQTVVRSINTTVVALLPTLAVLVVGFATIGPGTLLDLSLVLFIGMAVGAYSSIFIATPLLVTLRSKEPEVQQLEKAALRYQQRHGAPTSHDVAPHAHELPETDEPSDEGAPEREATPTAARTAVARETHRYATSGPRNQPRRAPKSRR
ncbi:protein translocase subunit SecF [Phycicoccus ginsengisoli]